MLLTKPLRWSVTIQNHERRRVRDASRIYRQFSSSIRRDPLQLQAPKPFRSIQSPIRHTLPFCFTPVVPVQWNRFASTNLAASTQTELTPGFIPEHIQAPLDEFISSPLDSVTTAEYPHISEHIGYLKELGLDYGWGPTAFVQTLLEHVHVYTGTPWWGSILLTALFVRLALLRSYITASDTSARMVLINPDIKPIKDRLDAARHVKDVDEMRRLAEELRALYRSADVHIWKVFVPLLQIPLGFGTFRLLRGMSDLPVPGLENGGLLWLQDLTLSDPYFILPVVTGLAFHVTFKKGGELGASPMMTDGWKTTFIYGLPIMTSVFMVYWPGSLQLTFAFTSMLSLSQAYLLRQPWMRTFLKIQPLLKPKAPTSSSYSGTITTYKAPLTPSSPPPAPKGIIGGAIHDIKGAVSQGMKTARGVKDAQKTNRGAQRRTAGELKRAKAYDEKRKREIAEEKFKADKELSAKLERRSLRQRGQ